MAFNPLGAIGRFFGKAVGWGFAQETPPDPKTYFINTDGSVTFPFGTPGSGANSINQLLAELAISPVGGLNDGDTIEVVDNGTIYESSIVEPMANNVTIRSWGTNGINFRNNKPKITTNAQVLFDSHTNGNTGFKVIGLNIIPDSGCERVYKGISGEFSYNKVDGLLADSAESIVYAEYSLRMVNNEIKSVPDRILMINDTGQVGEPSDVHHNTFVGWNRVENAGVPAIRVESGFVYSYSNNFDGEGVSGQIAYSAAQ